MLTNSGFETSEVRSLCGVDTTELAASPSCLQRCLSGWPAMEEAASTWVKTK